MHTQHARPLSRRRFLGGLTFTGTAGGNDVSGVVAAARRPDSSVALFVFQLGPQDDDTYDGEIGDMVESAAGTLT